MTAEEEFEGWAFLELMGHRRLAGEVRTVVLGGSPMIRIDVPSGCDTGLTAQLCAKHGECICGPGPELDNENCPLHGPSDHPAPPTTQFYVPSALYCLTPTTEDVVRKHTADRYSPPIHALGAGHSDDFDDEPEPDTDRIHFWWA